MPQNTKLICNDIVRLNEILSVNTTLDSSTKNVNKYTFNTGEIVNVFTTGTVNFQGKKSNCDIEESIRKKIDAINELATPLKCTTNNNIGKV